MTNALSCIARKYNLRTDAGMAARKNQRAPGTEYIDKDSLNDFLVEHGFRATDCDLVALLRKLERFAQVSSLRGDVGESAEVIGNRRSVESHFVFDYN